MTELDELLKKVSYLKDKYKDKEVFNLLHSVGFRSQEIMHSKFIATMLDPKGLHGMRNQNLKFLFDRIGIIGFKTEQAKVEIEQSAGNRRIDIKINIGNDVVIIENKVWAKDQDRQLADYYTACKTSTNRVEVIYLTIDGKKPTKNSLGEILHLNQVKCISYEKHIIPWIDECAIYAAGRVKTSLEMYSELVSDLINKNKYMNEIFEELKKDKAKLKLAIDVNSALQRRNYIREFSPEVIDFLSDCICRVEEDANPHPDEGNSLNIADGGHEFANWRFCFDDGDVYVTNFVNEEKYIHLFHPSDINNEKLKSLILEETDIVVEWLSRLFEDIRSY